MNRTNSEDHCRIDLEIDIARNCLVSSTILRGRRSHDSHRPSLYQDFVTVVLELAERYPAATVCWFDRSIAAQLTPRSTWPELLQHNLELRFFPTMSTVDWGYASIGLIEPLSPFFPVERQRNLTLPSWLVSPLAGVCRIELLAALSALDLGQQPLSALLLGVGKRGCRLGMVPYSDSRLATPNFTLSEQLAGSVLKLSDLSRFVRRSYGKKLFLIWLIGLFAWRRWLHPTSLAGVFVRSQPELLPARHLDSLRPQLPLDNVSGVPVDVVVPTYRRPELLDGLLQHLSNLDHLPRRVVVVEQVAKGSRTQESNLPEEHGWPFELIHQQVSWVGASRARNHGLASTSAEWVLLIDDDIRPSSDYLTHLVAVALGYRVDAIYAEFRSPSPDPTKAPLRVDPWYFASGVALCKREILLNAGGFDERLDGCALEDLELGHRLRVQGHHVFLTDQVQVQHLAPPSGGFRGKPLLWDGDKPQPFPSPSMLYSLDKNGTISMRIGLWIATLTSVLERSSVWTWPARVLPMVRQWRAARKWANVIHQRSQPNYREPHN